MTTLTNMNELTEQYRTLWGRIYAPLRRTLAGTWLNRAGANTFSLALDPYGRFELKSLATNTFSAGRYTVVGKNGRHYLALEPSEGQKLFLRIEEVDSLKLKVYQEDQGTLLELVKQQITS